MSQEVAAPGAGRVPEATRAGEDGRGWQSGSPKGTAGPAAGAGRGCGAVTIVVNRREYRVAGPEMTAREIKNLAGAPAHHMLILVAGGPGRAAEGGDEPMADADVVRPARGMRFRTVNAATFGSQTTMHAPPLLLEHIGLLESRGFAVEVTASDAIYIVIKDYPIPGDIWDRSSSDLLVMAHDTYPNAPIDMFWLHPPISRRNGPADGTGTETRNGKEWQSFSWHVGGWDPARDSLVTYLDVVDDRLRRDR